MPFYYRFDYLADASGKYFERYFPKSSDNHWLTKQSGLL